MSENNSSENGSALNPHDPHETNEKEEPEI